MLEREIGKGKMLLYEFVIERKEQIMETLFSSLQFRQEDYDADQEFLMYYGYRYTLLLKVFDPEQILNQFYKSFQLSLEMAENSSVVIYLEVLYHFTL